MALTFIDTNKLPRTPSTGRGEVTEVLNEALCGAKNVLGTLRWLKPGEKYAVDKSDKHQLIYLMDGKGSINLDSKRYEVAKGEYVEISDEELESIALESTKTIEIGPRLIAQPQA